MSRALAYRVICLTKWSSLYCHLISLLHPLSRIEHAESNKFIRTKVVVNQQQPTLWGNAAATILHVIKLSPLKHICTIISINLIKCLRTIFAKVSLKSYTPIHILRPNTNWMSIQFIDKMTCASHIDSWLLSFGDEAFLFVSACISHTNPFAWWLLRLSPDHHRCNNVLLVRCKVKYVFSTCKSILNHDWKRICCQALYYLFIISHTQYK